MLGRIYKKMLETQISRYKVPNCIAVMLSSKDLAGDGSRLTWYMVEWCGSLGVDKLVLCASESDPAAVLSLKEDLKDVPADILVHTFEGETFRLGQGGPIKLEISVGYGGRQEVAEVVASVLKKVGSGNVEPEEIDEEMIEFELRIKAKPDLVIQAGGRRLSDFMIWQTAYSEIYFAGDCLKEVDFLRAIRDYQRRERRFGK